MAKRKGPLGLLVKGIFLLTIVAGLVVVGISLFYPNDDLGSQMRGAGIPETYIDQTLDVKNQIKSKADMSGDDFLFTAKSIWWDVRDTFDLNLTSKVTLDLPPVRHVTQMAGMVKDDDPKEPMKPEMSEPTEIAEVTPEPSTPDEAVKDAMLEAQGVADKMAEPMPSEIKAPAETLVETPATPEPVTPDATEKPMDLTKAPDQPEPTQAEAISEETPTAEAAAAQPPEEIAALPSETPAAAPVEAAPVAETPPPPATAEERLATADLTYKQGLALFANATTPEQKSEVAKLFAQAAIDGHPGAQYSIGIMHYNGSGVAQDYAKAAEWFGRAADKNNAAAQYNLGILYYSGQGLPKDDKLAYKWINAAAENGDKKAIVARDQLKKALPSEITKPDAAGFSSTPTESPVAVTPTRN